MSGHPVPGLDELAVDYFSYLNGLGEAAREICRHRLGTVRWGVERGEEIVWMMDDIYGLLVTIDFPSDLTCGLRRTADMVRGVLERSRGDLTMTLR